MGYFVILIFLREKEDLKDGAYAPYGKSIEDDIWYILSEKKKIIYDRNPWIGIHLIWFYHFKSDIFLNSNSEKWPDLTSKICVFFYL